MITCAFYSYKGGVGRTMALANIAELCYRAGLKVLMIDWDLEAPGLERFFPIEKDDVIDRPGLMDMLLEYKKMMAQSPSKNNGQRLPFAKIDPFVVDIYPSGAGTGRLLLLPAGRRSREYFAEYSNTILTFDWHDFYENWEGELFFEWLRKQFKEEFDADIVLIDSRTGVTEIGGICIYQMADVVVMLTATNGQNLEGTDLMAREFTRPTVKVHRSGRPLEVIVVPARLELTEGGKLNKFKEDFLHVAANVSISTGSILKKEILWDLGIPYIPYYAFEEKVAIKERNEAIAEPMARSFEKLARALARIAPSDSSLKRAFGSDYAFDASYASLISDYGYDAFISYSHNDYEWVSKWLIPNLESSGLKVGTDLEVFDLGKPVLMSLKRAISNSRFILLVLTPEWIENEWSKLEAIIANSENPDSILARILPILLSPCRLPPLLANLAYANFSTYPNNEGEFSKLVDALRGASRLPEAEIKRTNIDWGEAPDINIFYGRTKELETLEQWILEDRCRLVAIVGMRGVGKTTLSVKLGQGGIGKTDLSLKLARGIQDQFEYVIWQRFLNAPKIRDILANMIKILSNQQEIDLPVAVDDQIARLLFYLRQHRCLLIFDNVETLLEGGKHAGQYREGYEEYGQLFRQIAEAHHKSCLLVTSREKPEDIALLEGKTRTVRSFELSGLDYESSKRIFETIGDFKGSEADWQELIEFYNGNPLALELVARHIEEVFSGDIPAFLKEREQIFTDLRNLLDWYFDRLEGPQREIMYWLAINREPMSLQELKDDILSPDAKELVASTLQLLQRLIPLERSAGRFTLQPVLMEYMTDRLVEQVVSEIADERISSLNNYAFLKAIAKDYVRESQKRLILQPVISKLLTRFGKTECEQRLKHLLDLLRETFSAQLGYAAGNILNCLIQINSDLRGTNFSRLSIWQAYLRETNLIDVNFTNADLSKSMFTDIFGSILSVAFSPDGSKLAAGTDTGEIRVWYVNDGTALLTFSGHTDWVWGLAFSPDGSTLASGSSDQTIRLWDVTNERCIHVLRGHSHRVRSVAFSPDGTQIASASEDQTIRIWDVDGGLLLHILEGHSNPIRAVVFAADGKTLISGSDDQTLRVWNVVTEECVDILEGHSSQIWSLALSSDGKTIASGSDDRTVRIWDITTKKCLKILRGHTNCIFSLAFTPNGEFLASGSADGTVRLWDVNTGQPLNTLQGHKNWINSVSFSPDGMTLASGSHDQTARLWEVSTGYCLLTLQGYSNSVRSVIFNPKGNLLISGDRAVHIWETHNGHNIATFQGHTSWIRTLVFSPDGTLVASGSDDQTIRLWRVKTMQPLYTLQGHTNRVKSIAFSPDGELLISGSDDHTVRLWNVRLGRNLKVLREHTNRIRSVAFSPKGGIFASGSDDRTVRVWDRQTDQTIYTLEGHANRIWSIVFSPDGQFLASGSEDSTIRLWNVGTGECLHVLQGHINPVWSIVVSPDGTLLASSSEDRTVRLWEVRSGRCIHTLSGHTKPIWAIAFSADNKLLASGSHDLTIRLWDTHSGEEIACLQGHTEPIWSLAFSPDTKMLISGSDDGTCRLWDLSTKANQNVLKSERPYERMNITGITGLTESQKSILRSLGAVEKFEPNNVGGINL